jgi:hypothetical protein
MHMKFVPIIGIIERNIVILNRWKYGRAEGNKFCEEEQWKTNEALKCVLDLGRNGKMYIFVNFVWEE